MSCPSIITIPDTECIGNSLTTINNNFSALEVAACDNQSFITSLNNSITNLNTLITDLTNITVPGAAKAWVSFDGTKDDKNFSSSFNTNRYIFSGYNVSSVFRKGAGDYRITFTTRFLSRNYVIIGTSRQTQVGGQYTWLQPYDYRTAFADIKIVSQSGNAADPQNVSVVIY